MQERQRERDLRERLHEAELRLAEKPVCGPKTQLPVQPPQPDPKKEPESPRPGQLILPQKAADLTGCWQSDRGDIEIVSDDAERKHIGQVRICYCFDSTGTGEVRMTYTDGAVCRGPLRQKIEPGKLVMSHGKLPCTKHGSMIGADITCKEDNGVASCDSKNHGEYLTDTTVGEKYHHVENSYCGWTPRR